MHEIAKQRLAQFEAELYDNQVMLRISERLGNEADIAQFTANINTIQVAIEEWSKELAE